ncbi:hypothetical protein ABPG72_002424 [Tetrahymena utriculariae]
MQFTQDNNQQAYLKLLFNSYESIQYLNIALQQNNTCFIILQQQNRTLEKINTDISFIQSLTSLQSSNLKLKQIKKYYQDGQCLQNIEFKEIHSKNIDQNNVYWSDVGTYSQYIQNFYLKDMNLSVQNKISLNKDKQMKNFQMFNITLNIKQSLIIQNFDKVLLQNLSITNQNLGLNQIIIQNCKSLVIEQVEMINKKILNSIFILINNTVVTINKVMIQKSNSSIIFEIDNNQSANIFDFLIFDSNNLQVLQILLSKNINISNVRVSLVQFSKILNILGSNNVHIKAVSVENSNQLQLIMIKPYIQNDKQYLSIHSSLQKVNLTNSTGVSLDFNANTILMSDKYIYQLCLHQNGSSLSIINSMSIGNVLIKDSSLIENQAQFSTGGAISLQNTNLFLINTTIIHKKALIGGGVYYKQVIPDFVLDFQNEVHNSNIIKQNIAKLYGNNIGSTLRRIKINLNDIKASDDNMNSQNANNSIIINQFKSGNQIYFEKIQLLDEENNPLLISTAIQLESRLAMMFMQQFRQYFSKYNRINLNNKFSVQDSLRQNNN